MATVEANNKLVRIFFFILAQLTSNWTISPNLQPQYANVASINRMYFPLQPVLWETSACRRFLGLHWILMKLHWGNINAILAAFGMEVVWGEFGDIGSPFLSHPMYLIYDFHVLNIAWANRGLCHSWWHWMRKAWECNFHNRNESIELTSPLWFDGFRLVQTCSSNS